MNKKLYMKSSSRKLCFKFLNLKDSSYLSLSILIAFFFTLTSDKESFAQVESPLLTFTRGAVWQSMLYGKVGPVYNNWRRTGPSLDWPGFDASWVNEDIGGVPSHMVSGGFWVGAKKPNDSVLVVEDWSLYGTTVSAEGGAKYIAKKHAYKFPNGANHWLAANPNFGEEVIESIWEYNPNYFASGDPERQLPVRVRRTAHQWSGSIKDENYIIYEYVVKNIAPEIRANYPQREIVDTLKHFYMLLSYGLQVNSRSWNVLFRQETPGARNSWHFYDAARKMLWARSVDYPLTTGSTQNEEYGFTNSLGRVVNGVPQGEWLAPGFVGIRLLYSSPDTTGIASRINKAGWSAGDNSLDLSGPFTGVAGTVEARYAVLRDPANAYQFVPNSADTTFMKKSRMWSLMSLGPWNLLPGDSIVIVVAEIVNGMSYADALNPNLTQTTIFQRSNSAFNASVNRAKFTYDNNFNHPDPPAAPKFKVDYYKGEVQTVANTIQWGNETESLPDPDDGTLDLYGYKLYRSDFLPIGPWENIATIIKGDPNYFINGKYLFIDSTVEIGRAYYYALTAFDTGKANWPINPSAIFPETNSNRVPPMESSIFANRMNFPFLATLPSTKQVNDVLVVPNPFVIREGVSRPGEADQIQFVNIPNPCTIRIYTIRGDLVKTISVDETVGGIVTWNQVTDFGQFVESGIYIFHVDSPFGSKIGKLAIVR